MIGKFILTFEIDGEKYGNYIEIDMEDTKSWKFKESDANDMISGFFYQLKQGQYKKKQKNP